MRIYFLGDRFYYISEYQNIEGIKKYYISSVDKLGKDKKNYKEIKNVVNYFNVLNGYFLVNISLNDKNKLIVFDQNFNEKNLDLENINPKAFWGKYLIENEFKENENSDTAIISVENLENKKKLKNTGDITALSNKYIAFNQKDGISYLYDVDKDERVIEIKNELITNIENEFIYTSEYKDYKINSYKQYNLIGELISEIKPEKQMHFISSVKNGIAICRDSKTDRIFYVLNFNDKSIKELKVN